MCWDIDDCFIVGRKLRKGYFVGTEEGLETLISFSFHETVINVQDYLNIYVLIFDYLPYYLICIWYGAGFGMRWFSVSDDLALPPTSPG